MINIITLPAYSQQSNLQSGVSFSEELELNKVIFEALRCNPKIRALKRKIAALKHNKPQAETRPDPVAGLAYQSEGYKPNLDERFSYIRISLGQTFPWPGKLKLKGQVVEDETLVQLATLTAIQLDIESQVKEIFYDLYLFHKDIDIIESRIDLYSRIEKAAIARYSTGLGSQQDILMAQTEKYKLIAQLDELNQQIDSAKAMLNAIIARDANSPLGLPKQIKQKLYNENLDSLIKTAYENSPELYAKKYSINKEQTANLLSKKDYYPDIYVDGSIAFRGRQFKDLVKLETKIPLPLYYKSKQNNAVKETEEKIIEAKYEYQYSKYNLSSDIRKNHSTITTAERLMKLYDEALINKTYQDFELALAGYTTGDNDALTVITRLNSLIKYELLYWQQYVEREKAIARIKKLIGASDLGVNKNE